MNDKRKVEIMVHERVYEGLMRGDGSFNPAEYFNRAERQYWGVGENKYKIYEYFSTSSGNTNTVAHRQQHCKILQGMEIQEHRLGDLYSIRHRDGSVDSGWKLAYSGYLPGTYIRGVWRDYKEPYVLVERPLYNGTDFREVPARFLTKQ